MQNAYAPTSLENIRSHHAMENNRNSVQFPSTKLITYPEVLRPVPFLKFRLFLLGYTSQDYVPCKRTGNDVLSTLAPQHHEHRVSEWLNIMSPVYCRIQSTYTQLFIECHVPFHRFRFIMSHTTGLL